MSTIFSKIIKGDIPCYKIAEDESFYAFLDIRPLAKGHTLVIPKIETDYIFDLNDKELADMFVFSKKIAKAIHSAVPCIKVGIAVIGLEVPHAHIHLIPLQNVSDLDFSKPKMEFSAEIMESTANFIREQMNKA
ncbi:MAG: HIT family protein [Saprospiraceae bacterium]|nr:HIT family protein [Saprospiraceae bacterium]